MIVIIKDMEIVKNRMKSKISFTSMPFRYLSDQYIYLIYSNKKKYLLKNENEV